MKNNPVQPRPQRLKRRLRRALIVLVAAPLLLILSFHLAVAFWPYPQDIDRLPPDAVFLTDAHGAPLAQFAAPDEQWRLSLTADQLSPHLIPALLAAEDARFYDHHGVDWKSAAASLWQDAASLHLKRGGSTITMQLQRLRQPIPHTLLGKVEQAIRAAQLETRQGKQQILLEYLNRAPFGGNLVGVGAASWRYFNRPCKDLSLAQAALLAALPQNPTNARPDRFPDRAKIRRDFILHRMLALRMISPAAHDSAIAEPITATWQPLTQSNLGQSASHSESKMPPQNLALPTLTTLARQSSGGILQTTLDLPTQELITRAAQSHLDQHGGQINELAILVVDIHSANCIAAASLSRSGVSDLDLTQRPRSTGSVIKPLIYAAAFDASIASPQTILDDSPAAWPGYSPGNYDQQFRGRLSAADALAQSRNIPALRLLSQVGVERAIGICAAAGLRTLAATPQRYGLSLAVGGAQATPAEVAAAYTTLASRGLYRPLNYLARTSSAPATRILSSQACNDVIASLNRPDRTAPISPPAAALRAAWKTGTSSGHRDAWCAAIGPAHVIVVWMGNANSAGSEAIVGADAAAPLALELLAAIDAALPPIITPTAPPAQLAAARLPSPQLTIISPTRDAQIIQVPDLPPSQQKLQLKASLTGASDPTTLTWFIDGLPIGNAAPNTPLWWQPTPGRHELRATTPTGLSDQQEITITR